MRQEFKDSINKALNNPNLTGALGRFSEAYRISRAKAYEGIDFEAVRTRIAEIKSYAACAFRRTCRPLRAKCRGSRRQGLSHRRSARGSRLHPEPGEGERRQEHRQVQVDGVGGNPPQSLTSKKAGIEVSETDLGEWIIQLAGQTPSHMVMPAIHMTKEEVADVFSEQVEAGPGARYSHLVKFARGKLRTKFLNAEMGITGANIAVAETGTLVIVTNEGNARLTTTLPKIHVAIVGTGKADREFRRRSRRF